MDEKQLQFLFDNYAKDKGFKDIHEFRDLMSDSNSRKVFFDDSNKELGFKDFNDFEATLDVKKKESSPAPSQSSVTPSPSPAKEDNSHYADLLKPQEIPAGQRMNEPSSTESVQPKITASYDDFIAHHDERIANKKSLKQDVINKAALGALKSKGVIKPEDDGKALDVTQFSELSKEKQRLQEALDNKDAVITYKDGQPVLKEKGEGSVGGYLWNKITGAIGGMSNAAGDLTMQMLAKIPAARGNATEEEVMKDYRENLSPTIRDATTQLAGAKVSEEREKEYNSQFLTRAAGSLASMIPAMGFPKGSGFILQSYDGGLQSINNTEAGKNLPESTKTIFATAVGVATGAMMHLGIDKIFGKETDKVASGLAANTITDLLSKSSEPITADVYNAAIQGAVKTLKDKVIAAGGKLGKSAITGGLFGASMEATNIAAEKLTNKATGVEAFEPKTWGEEFGRVLNASAEMAAGGTVLGSIQIPFSKTRDYIKEKVGEAKTPEDVQAIKDELIGKVNGDENAAQQISGLVDKYVDVYNKIPPEANNKSAIVDNIQERDDLENHIGEKQQELQTVDPAFHDPIIEEINTAKGRVDEINKEIAEKAKEPEPESNPDEATTGEQPATGETNEPLPTDQEQPKGQETETGLPSGTGSDSGGGSKTADAILEEALYGKKEGREKIDMKGKLAVEPKKPISEMNSDELFEYSKQVKEALKTDKDDASIDNVSDLRDTSQLVNFVENSENINDLANSIKSAVVRMDRDNPSDYSLAVLNAAKKKASEMGIDPKDLVAGVLKKTAKDFKDADDAATAMQSVLDKLIPKNKPEVEIKKLEEQRDAEIKEVDKPKLTKFEYVKEADLIKMDNETELIEKQRDIRKTESLLKKLIECLTK